jgi:hypothetical protein
MTERIPVQCSKCRHIIRDQVGDGNGWHDCQHLVEYRKKIAELPAQRRSAALSNALMTLDCIGDNKAMYPDVERFCPRFEKK